MSERKPSTSKGRTLTTIGIIIGGLFLYKLIIGPDENLARNTQQHSDYAKRYGLAIVSSAIASKATAEFDIPSTIVSQIGATTYQLAGSLSTNDTISQKKHHSWYVQIEAIPHCFDYNSYSCWVTISGPSIVPE
ncbi:hypothetical protein [Desulforhopalus sp. 52FAK]